MEKIQNLLEPALDKGTDHYRLRFHLRGDSYYH